MDEANLYVRIFADCIVINRFSQPLEETALAAIYELAPAIADVIQAHCPHSGSLHDRSRRYQRLKRLKKRRDTTQR
jgi:hypothetical protein